MPPVPRLSPLMRATTAALSSPLEDEAEPRIPRVLVDPLGVIAESKDRLERLAALVERHLRDPEDEAVQTQLDRKPEPDPLRGERWRRAATAATVPALLAVQASVHQAAHVSMLVPVVLALLLCLALGLNQRMARSLGIGQLPLLLLLQTAVAVGLAALYHRVVDGPVFERMLLGLTLEGAAAAACCSGFALLTVATGPAPWAHRLLAAGLAAAIGGIPFLG
jgi:hypothetical protein